MLLYIITTSIQSFYLQKQQGRTAQSRDSNPSPSLTRIKKVHVHYYFFVKNMTAEKILNFELITEQTKKMQIFYKCFILINSKNELIHRRHKMISVAGLYNFRKSVILHSTNVAEPSQFYLSD